MELAFLVEVSDNISVTMQYLRFVFGKETEAYYIYQSLKSPSSISPKRSRQSNGVSSGLLEKIGKSQSFEEIEKDILQLVNSDYKTLLPFIEKSRQLYKESWDEINDAFFKRAEEITNHRWRYQKYECVLSNYHKGISNWGTSNTIVRSWKENPYTQRRITAHELLISHYFDYFRSKHSNETLKDGEIWQLAEIAAWAITGLDSEMLKLWPWDGSGYYTNHNYPHLVKLQLALKEPFVNRKSFDEYVRIAIVKLKGAKQSG